MKLIQTVRQKLQKFLDIKKLDQTFSLFEKVEDEFVEVNDLSFKSGKDRDDSIKEILNDKGEVTKTIKTLQVGFDTEFQANKELSNDIISYQIYLKAYNIGVIFYTNQKTYKRFQMGHFLQMLNDVFNHNKAYDEIDIIAHFTAAEINSFSDYKEFVKNNNLGGSIKMIQKSFVTTKSFEYKYTSITSHVKKARFLISDTWLMSGKESLNNITKGDEFKIKKINIGTHIKDMKNLLKTDKTLFDKYSIIDAYLTLEYYQNFYKTLKKTFGVTSRIITASSISEKVIKLELGDKFNDIFGKTLITKKELQPNGKLFTKSYLKLKKGISILSETYYGGRNETFCSGVSNGQEWGDYDLKSAYPTAMLVMQDMDWEHRIGITNGDWHNIDFNDVGMITLKFKFKDDVPIPAFPIKDEETGGLVFVREGETTLPIPEVYMAWKNHYLDFSGDENGNQKTEIITGYKFAKKDTLEFSKLITAKILNREKYKKGTQENTFYKLINNSSYGKITQGVDKKNNLNFFKSAPENDGDFNYSDLEYNQQRESSMYNPGMAAFITGTIRAMVTEQMNCIEMNRWGKVLSVTTDGYMLNTKLTEDQITALNLLPYTRKVAEMRECMIGEKGVLELKHWTSPNAQNIAVKTRCYWMNDNEANDTKDYSHTLVSRGGAQSQGGGKGSDADYMTNLLAKADNDTTIEIHSLNGAIDFLKGKDLVSKNQTKTFNLDYDFKRLPKISTAVDEEITYTDNGEIKKSLRIKFETVPHKTYKEYEQIKHNYKTYLTVSNSKTINKVRTVKELNEFLEYSNLRELGIKVFKNQDNILRYMIKSFLLYTMMSQGKTPKDINVVEIASQLNINTKQIHNLLRSEMFKNYVLDMDSIPRLDRFTFKKYENEINNLLDGLDITLKAEFLSFIQRPVYKKQGQDYSLKSILTKNNKDKIDEIFEYNENQLKKLKTIYTINDDLTITTSNTEEVKYIDVECLDLNSSEVNKISVSNDELFNEDEFLEYQVEMYLSSF